MNKKPRSPAQEKWFREFEKCKAQSRKALDRLEYDTSIPAILNFLECITKYYEI